MFSAHGSFIAYQCVHGLGHGLMLFHELRPAECRSPVCDELAHVLGPDLVLRAACSWKTSLFLVRGSRRAGSATTTRSTRAKTVAERHKLYCYLMVTSRILQFVELRLREGRTDVSQERQGVDRDLLPVPRARCIRTEPREREGDPRDLREGRRHGVGVRLRGGARPHEQRRGLPSVRKSCARRLRRRSRTTASRASGRSSVGCTRPSRSERRRASPYRPTLRSGLRAGAARDCPPKRR